ncbi:MAG: cupin domain-containing protein [Gammaproteobacteria bacterium]|nr:cupin domain-containing protein [Gammaproteobacteria bacterium]MDE2250741.1 cupin domain-containing protein [Gammaproteobacteria bacterium]
MASRGASNPGARAPILLRYCFRPAARRCDVGIRDFKTLGPGAASAPSPANVLAGDPRQQVWNVLSSGDGRFHVGEWASGVGAWRVNYTEYELCHLLAGAVRLTDEHGAAHIYRAGDTFVIPGGFRGTWEVLEPCRKIYAIYE